MTSLIRDPLLWILLVVLVAAVFAVQRARRTNLALRRAKNDLETGMGHAQSRIDQLQGHISSLDTQHRGDLANVRADAESSTKAVLKSAMGTLQSLSEEQQLLLDGLLKKYGDDTEVLADLMSVDHTGSQFGRRAKGISVLCGGWLGRREGVATVYDVARSAQGRIKDFNRVSIHAQASVAVTSKAVEPVAVVLAELLDNATTYSAPGTPVEVNIQAVPTGVCFIVDDAGLGMDQETKDRAAALLSAEGAVDITGLGDPPRFGFAVCGMLATRYGFAVSVGSVSPYGGVRAVIRVPESLLAAEAVPPAEPVQEEQGPQSAPQRLAPVPVGPSHVVGTTNGGLPKRRRRQGPISVVPAPEPAMDEQTSESAGEVTASRLGAFARGTQLGRNTNTTEGSDHQ
ncbi:MULTISPECIES: ATP-binding protein [Streptomyces]|uniref:histidine kinase n=1 Tax=Streptomyces edwardsiae TaxID=3075527 RepID=A0ABU2QAK7_9ACTN|nr:MULTISPECIES: ATP-binding protein [unclassified Streptomyces]MDT0401481.1 ATP-binding protein [Streptomyces sp. DSM 41635]